MSAKGQWAAILTTLVSITVVTVVGLALFAEQPRGLEIGLLEGRNSAATSSTAPATGATAGDTEEAQAHRPEVSERPPAVIKRLLGGADIDDTRVLPTAGGLVAVEAGGLFYILSQNGRFLFDGTLRDTWHGGREIASMADVKRYGLRLDLDALGLDFSQLVTLRFGHGRQQVTVFAAHDCAACRKALTSLQGLSDTYSVRVVVLPASVDDPAVEQIDCAASTDEKLALLMGDNAEPSARRCEGTQARLMTTFTTAQVIGVQRVPFIIAPDGRVMQGLPRNETLASFLAESGDDKR